MNLNMSHWWAKGHKWMHDDTSMKVRGIEHEDEKHKKVSQI